MNHLSRLVDSCRPRPVRGVAWLVYACVGLLWLASVSAGEDKVFPGADERTPSRAHYFSWINNAWEGSTEAQTLINLDFFQWLRDEYGMQLDCYALDAGNLDTQGEYVSTESASRQDKPGVSGFMEPYHDERYNGYPVGSHSHPAKAGHQPEASIA